MRIIKHVYAYCRDATAFVSINPQSKRRESRTLQICVDCLRLRFRVLTITITITSITSITIITTSTTSITSITSIVTTEIHQVHLD